MAESIEQLRDKHRKLRIDIDAPWQRRNAENLWRQVAAIDAYRKARSVAAYIAIRGEIDVSGLIDSGTTEGKQFFLPMLREQSMYFGAWSPGQPLVKKSFGLLEPDVPIDNCIDIPELDVVLTPLVVFDDNGNRIGQGGGFYDRTFAHKHESPLSKPIMIGVAHDSQRELRLDPQAWDIPLDMIATDRAVYSGKR